MPDVNVTALTAALSIAEADAEARGWGDDRTFLFRVVGDSSDPYLELMLHTDEYPAAAVDGWVSDGLGLGNEPGVHGLVALSEAWRHLLDDELRVALPQAVDKLIMFEDDDPAEVWAEAAAAFRSRTRPRDLPDHLRAEVRVALCVLRDGTAVQMVRDRDADEVTVNAFSVSELPPGARIPEALMRLLAAPGRAV